MKIAVLYICTGKYNLFFPDFYLSAKQYLLLEAAKTFFVWTDDISIGDELSDVQIIEKKCEGFPSDSLFRFEMFMQVKEQLKSFDYIYFFNANVLFLQPIGHEILPDGSGLAMGIWPRARERQPRWMLPYERNKKSLAYIAPYGKDYIYYMGGLNGGRAETYLDMIHTLCNNIRDDYSRGIIARVHDESHINAYMRSHAGKIIGSNGFLLPEEWLTEGDNPKIILREKTKIDQYFNKGRDLSAMAKALKFFSILWNAIRWYLMF